MLARFRILIDFLVYGNFFIALCAVAMVLQTNYLRDFNVAGSALLIFIFSATFFLYNFHKYLSLSLQKDLKNTPRYAHFLQFDIPLSILSFIALMLCFDTYMTLRMDVKRLIYFFACGASFYVIPYFKGIRFRDIFLVKNLLIASVWACMVVALPAIALGRDWWGTDTVLMLEKFFFIFALTIVFDIRDRNIDAKKGIKTIPLSMGVQKAKNIAYLALILSLLMSCTLFYFQNYTVFILLKIALSLVVAYFFIKKTDESRSDYFYYLGVDGLMLLQSCIVIFL